MRRLLKIFVFLFSFVLLMALAGASGAIYLLWHYSRDLPDYKQLAKYEPPTVTRVHAGDGRLIAEYATERRVFVPVKATPRRVIQAFIAAEDQNFYTHPGVDFVALVRAVVTNVVNLIRDRRPVGASTITQQVAKNFLLTNELSIERKIKEAILAFRIERAYSKDRILELYLNEIYLGYGSFGCAAAALNYFNKSLGELTVAEAAYLAALPKAPNNYHPIRKRDAAVQRRNWVVGRMFEEGFIDYAAARKARREYLNVVPRVATQFVDADYFVEEVRREIIKKYGKEGLYEGGLSVRTTVDPKLQAIAEAALRWGLMQYDRRHGWRGPLAQIPVTGNWLGHLSSITQPVGIGDWRLAVVLGHDDGAARIGLVTGAFARIPLGELKWARRALDDRKRGPKIKRPPDALAVGDVVMVEHLTLRENPKEGESKEYPPGTYGLRQIPEIGGGLVALDPHTGRVLAMAGGFDYEISEFNRVTQARRQPGSAFKPFVYIAALDNGYTPATMILDAPFVIDQGPGLGKWKPANFTRKFYGPAPMRIGIEKSRNLMTVRLAQAIGIERVADYAQRFGIVDQMPNQLAMALGAGETTLLRLTTGYAMLVNGGKRITPSLIDRIQDRHGKTVFKHDRRHCPKCRVSGWQKQTIPKLPDIRKQVVDPASAYQIVSMLQGVVRRGTGRRISTIPKPLAGKTGTTNKSKDTWFMGFSPDLAVGGFIGFDHPTPLGRRETGSSVAAPAFKRFMEGALLSKPAIPFRIPPGIRLIKVDGKTGLPARPGAKSAILEAFKAGTEPDPSAQRTLIVGTGGGTPGTASPNAASKTGGLY
jgi:penicillin-binding protein 1A